MAKVTVVWIVDMTDIAFENVGKFKYLRTTAVNETAFWRKLRAGQVTSGHADACCQSTGVVLLSLLEPLNIASALFTVGKPAA
jgi:hypothetical protein